MLISIIKGVLLSLCTKDKKTHTSISRKEIHFIIEETNI
jgi:hypothetical protein